MLFSGSIFLIRYFGKTIPFVPLKVQQNFAESNTLATLIIGIGFLVGFLAALITIYTKRSKFSYILPVLRIAKKVFWPNCYMFFFSFIFTIISLGAFIANISLLAICLTKKNNLINPAITTALVIVEALWTHGFLEALSDYFFESVAIHWYYQNRR